MPNITLYNRHYWILSLIGQLVGRPTADTLQYFIFWLQQNRGNIPYEFFPTLQGPFSLRLDSDLKMLLQERILIHDDQTRLSFNETFLGDISNKVWKQAKQEIAYWQSITDENIKTFVKSKYHDWWLANYAHDKTQNGDPILITIGYEGKSVEAFFAELVANQVEVLADIRANPYSRKFGFTKKILEEGADLTRIRYQPIQELGIPKSLRKEVSGENDKQALLDYYEFTILPEESEAIDYLLDLIKVEGITALLCYENAPSECHRSRLAKVLKRHFGRNLKLNDLR